MKQMSDQVIRVVLKSLVSVKYESNVVKFSDRYVCVCLQKKSDCDLSHNLSQEVTGQGAVMKDKCQW